MTCKAQFETIDNGLLVRAPAKINLSLLIAGKQPDGFHEIETVMAKVNFYDEILIEPGQKEGIELICTGPQWAPAGQDNLIYKAAEMLLAECNYQADVIPAEAGIKITLTKNIPAGSGLGSASSDAAATLLGLNKFLNLNAKAEKLNEIAASLGSDISFFLGGPLALCTGKGEKIKKLDEIFNFSALLILPDVSVSTKKVYADYKHNNALYQELKSQINSHIAKNRFDLLSAMCANMLQISCFSLYKEIGELKAKIESLGFGPLCLSGSGSAMFYIINNSEREGIREKLHTLEDKFSYKTVIVSNNRW